MSDLLLDTHVLVWSLVAPPRLSRRAAAALERSDQTFVSAASFYEIEAKRRRNAQRGVEDEIDLLPKDFVGFIQRLDLSIIDLTATEAALAGRLQVDHGDPWDRILLAQAQDRGLTLITADSAIRRNAGAVPVLW